MSSRKQGPINIGEQVRMNQPKNMGDIDKGSKVDFEVPGNPFLKATAYKAISRSLNEAQNFGTAPMHAKAKAKETGSMMRNMLKDPNEEEELPSTPGFAYMTHLFNRSQAGEKIKEAQKKNITKGLKVFSESMEGVKTALSMIGLHSGQNLGGLPIDIDDAYKIWYGDKEIGDIEKSQFQHDIQDGVSKIDPKKVRKFVNNDGSLTWEILNDDKTVMNRFTFGDYAGTKLFAQGGYSKFAELLKKAKEKLGPDVIGEFDSMRDFYKR